jgi:uncharacterized protein YbjT (DUF2867 family)
MRVVVIGAGGFIGSRIVPELLSRGHTVMCLGRNPDRLRRRFPTCEATRASLATDGADEWQPRLIGVEAVINTAGILRGDLETIHHRGPAALFDACANARVLHLVQISALGAGAQADSRFLATKNAADRHLLETARQLGLRGWCALRPSLVIGRGGASTALFCALAAFVRPVRLGPGNWRTQPIHVADLARIVAGIIEALDIPPLIDVVGPEPMTTDELTAALRAWLGLPPLPFVTLPLPLIRGGGRIGDLLPNAALNTESLTMLARGNTADADRLAKALAGWMPRRLGDALAAEPSVPADLWFARMQPVRTVLRAALAAVWVGSAAASFALGPNGAQALLSRLALDPLHAIALTWSGATLDLALGLALLPRPWRRPVLYGQFGVMLLYTMLATVVLPGLWADPFGSLLKNFAVLAATLALLAVED